MMVCYELRGMFNLIIPNLGHKKRRGGGGRRWGKEREGKIGEVRSPPCISATRWHWCCYPMKSRARKDSWGKKPPDTELLVAEAIEELLTLKCYNVLKTK